MHVVAEPSPWGVTATSLALEGDLEETAEQRAEKLFDDARELAAEYDVEITTEVQLRHPPRKFSVSRPFLSSPLSELAATEADGRRAKGTGLTG